MKTLILALLMFASTAFAAGGGGPKRGGFDGAGGRQPAPSPRPDCPGILSVPELLATVAPTDNKTVYVRGMVENVGENFFTDQRFVLTDGDVAVDIAPWLPFSVAPGKNRPKTMSDVLGKSIVVKAVYKLQQVKSVGLTGVLTEVKQISNCK